MRQTIARTVGIDICKARLDVHLLPDGIERQFTNDAKGLRDLTGWLAPLAPERIVYEATGAYHRQLERRLAERACRWSKSTRSAAARLPEPAVISPRPIGSTRPCLPDTLP